MLKWMMKMAPAMLLATAVPALAGPNAGGASEATAMPAMSCCKNGDAHAACCKASVVNDVGDLQKQVNSLRAQVANTQQYAPDPDNHPLWP